MKLPIELKTPLLLFFFTAFRSNYALKLMAGVLTYYLHIQMHPDMMMYSFGDLVNSDENFQWHYLALVV